MTKKKSNDMLLLLIGGGILLWGLTRYTTALEAEEITEEQAIEPPVTTAGAAGQAASGIILTEQAVLQAQQAEDTAHVQEQAALAIEIEEQATLAELELLAAIEEKKQMEALLQQQREEAALLEAEAERLAEEARIQAELNRLAEEERLKQEAAAAAAEAARQERILLEKQWSDALTIAENAVTVANNGLTQVQQAYWKIHAALHDPRPVVAFEHDDYRGASREFVVNMPDAARDLDIYRDSGIKQNVISSITVKPGYKVYAWEHPNRSGASTIIDKTYPALNKHPWPHDNWGDRISSLQVDDTEIRRMFDDVSHNLSMAKSNANDAIERALTIVADIRLLNLLESRTNHLEQITVALRNVVAGLPV